MEQDITLNVQSGDALLGNVLKNVVYYDVVWGSLFETDDMFYANIVVPYNNVNLVKFVESDDTDVVFSVNTKAVYCPEDTTFCIRFVTLVDGVYHLISDYRPTIPDEFPCKCRMEMGEEPSLIKACQLPFVNIDGYYKFVIVKGENDSYTSIVFSAYSSDFIVSDNEDQAAQLLAICGPGKYYRYPTTGADVTKYINSVVPHTDIGDALYGQFKADNKDISDADFDSTTGLLDMKFNSYTSYDPNVQLIDVDSLDMRLFWVATDDYVSAVVKAMRDGTAIDYSDSESTYTPTNDLIYWTGEYSNNKTYYARNIVSCYGSVFVARSSGIRGVSPIAVDGSGYVSLANVNFWDCMVNNVELYNTTLGTDRKVQVTEAAMAKMIANRTWEPGVTYYSIET